MSASHTIGRALAYAERMSNTFDCDVLVAGAGPTGLAVAASLALRGVRVRVIDRLAAGANTSRAAVVHAHTLEALEPLGVVPQLLSRGHRVAQFAVVDRDRSLFDVDFGALRTAYPFTLMVSQAVTEAILLDRLTQLGVAVERPRLLVGLEQDAFGAIASLDDRTTLRARYVVGADGMHSVVREKTGIAFEGGTYAESFTLADVRVTGGARRDRVALHFSPAGMMVVAPLPDGAFRIVATVEAAPEVPDAAFIQSLFDARGPESDRATVREVLWGSRFRVHHRVAATYRAGRVLLAGDAAHVHSPAGGQGMNLGIVDAMRLADALGTALHGDDAALDRYAATRRPIAKQVVALTDRLTTLAMVRPALRPVRNAILSLVGRVPAFRRMLGMRLSGLAYRKVPTARRRAQQQVARTPSVETVDETASRVLTN